MPLETMNGKDLDYARQTLIGLIKAYERDIILEVCRLDEDKRIDSDRLASLRDTIGTLRGVIRDIASAHAKLYED